MLKEWWKWRQLLKVYPVNEIPQFPDMNNHTMKGDLNFICICVNSYYYAQITVFKDKTNNQCEKICKMLQSGVAACMHWNCYQNSL